MNRFLESLINTTSVSAAVACIAAGALCSKVTAHEVAYDSYPAPAFDIVSLTDSTVGLTVFKGEDGLTHNVIALYNDASCKTDTASVGSNVGVHFGSTGVEMTTACSTAGTLYLAPASAKADRIITREISRSAMLNVWGGPLGSKATFYTGAYSETLSKFESVE